MHRLVYADVKTEKQFLKSLKSIPRNEQHLILAKLGALAKNPRPQQFKILAQPVFIFGYWAPYRLRIGDYRLLYDVDETSKKVVLLALRRRSEKTYR
ncbi:MAG: type II toxin-antitoxin system RelE/ParE family toxin [Elusimicrobiota bacterium]